MFIVHTTLPCRESHDHEVGGLRFTFRPVWLPHQRRAMAAWFDDHDEEQVREAVMPHGARFQIVHDADVRPEGWRATASHTAAPSAAAPVMPSVRDIILRQGWELADLEGLPPLDGTRLDRAAGCSTRAGLCAAEMMLIQAPPGWGDRAHAQYPWEVLGFRPTPGFRPPSTGPKILVVPLPMQGEAPPDDDTHDDTHHDTSAARPVLPRDIDATQIDSTDPALLAYNPDPQVVATARRAVLAMIDSHGKPPSLNKVNANFNTTSLPTTNKAGLKALLDPIA